MATYPTRQPFFAQKVIRQLMKTCAAQDIGRPAALLVAYVVATEDAKRYTGPVTFFNGQLIPILGLRKWDSLDRARRAAVESGWLHYEPPASGTRAPGKYWATIPDVASQLDDSPTDESDKAYHLNGDASGDDTRQADTVNGYGSGYASGDGCGYGSGDGRGEPSILTLNPIPDPKEKPSGDGSHARDVDPRLLDILNRWNGLSPGVANAKARVDPPAKAVLGGWARVQADPEAREPFQDPETLFGKIGLATFCHGQGWFRIPWLFGKGKTGEWNAVKLSEGGYEGNGDGSPAPPPERVCSTCKRPFAETGETEICGQCWTCYEEANG